MRTKTQNITSGVFLTVHWYQGTTWKAWASAPGGKAVGTVHWSLVAGNVTVPAGVNQAVIQIRVESSGGSAWIDDIMMVDVASAAPPPEDTTPPTVAPTAPTAAGDGPQPDNARFSSNAIQALGKKPDQY